MNWRDLATEALKGQQADYIEVRLEEAAATRLQYRGRELEDVGRSTSFGGNVRALVSGGWGFVSFNRPEGLKDRVSLAIRQARLVGKEDFRLAPVAPAVEVVPPLVKKDPGQVPLAHKKGLLDEYNHIIWSVPGLQTSTVYYADGRRHGALATSHGTYVEQSRIDVALRLGAVARRDGDVQQASLSIGGLGNFGVVEGLQEEVKAMAQKAVSLLDAPTLKGGEYTVVLDPILAGVFAHEAFGHLSEADFLHENPQLKEVMVLGRRFGETLLNIVDGAAIPGLRGSYRYDDEGVPSSRSHLIREGVLVGRLHSRETAARMGEPPTGNARALDYRFPPIVRMTNTVIEPGNATLDDLLSGIQEGVYVGNWQGGMTSMEMFTFTAGESRMIRNGKLAEVVRPVVLSGNVFSTLANVDAVGNDLGINQGGGCGKGGQSPLPVSNGSPHIRIRRCLVGGK